MPDEPITGREPALPGDEATGREPLIGGEGSLTHLLRELADGGDLPSGEALGERLAGELPGLIATLDGDDRRQQPLAAWLIGILAAEHPPSEERAVTILVQLLDDAHERGDEEMIPIAAEGLGYTANPRAAEVLVPLLAYRTIELTSYNYKLHRAVFNALARLGTVALPALEAAAVASEPNHLNHPIEVINRICREHPDAVEPVAAWIGPAVLGGSLRLTYPVSQLLHQVATQELVGHLLDAIRERERGSDFRQRLIGALSYLPDTRIPEMALDVLAGEDRPLHGAAMTLLKHSTRGEDIPRLIDLASHPDHEVRRYAIAVLAVRRVRSAFDTFVVALVDPQVEVRLEAVLALRNIDTPDAVPALAAMVHDPDAWVRRDAAQALIKLRRRYPARRAQIEGALRAMSNDPDAWVRTLARRALSG